MDIDRTIAHYRVVEKLGEGGMGVVWKARDTHLDRFVALKLLPPSRVGDPERRRRFVQEAKAASALQHPNIVHIYDIGEAEGALYIAMEYVPGQTLERYIEGKSLTLGDTLKYAAQLTDAMAAAHAAGVIHRDLKPSNVLVTDDGLVKVTDLQYSPDGKRIAFESERSGNLEIWVCDSDGGNCGQLTWIGSRYTGVPTWSPDGRQIAFYSRVDGHSQIFTIGVDGGAPPRLTSDKSDNFFPRWSRDGRWIYFASNRTGMNQVWKIPPRGGTEVQVTRQGGFAAAESPDGKWLYFTKNGNADTSLWRMPVAGGEETQILDSVTFFNYAVVEDGIYFIAKATEELAVQFHSFRTGRTRIIAPVVSGYVGFSVSPDRKWILYTVSNRWGSDLMLVENFR